MRSLSVVTSCIALSQEKSSRQPQQKMLTLVVARSASRKQSFVRALVPKELLGGDELQFGGRIAVHPDDFLGGFAVVVCQQELAQEVGELCPLGLG
ncbi:hypothetical protein J3A64_002512 [Pseudarthrobacter sp. PvP004]|nr:hypothetical protein [Pseudarthrobacter sp. PvP004]